MNPAALLRALAIAASRLRWPPGRPLVRQVTVHGLRLLVLAHEDVGREIAATGAFEPRETEYLLAALRPGDICVDAGANTGYHALPMAARLDQGSLHAFEPAPLAFHLLSAGAALNRLERLVANRLALADRDGEAQLHLASDGAYSSLAHTGRKPAAGTLRVATRTLDDYLAEARLPRVDILKADVEGAEERLLAGAAGLLADPARRPRLVMLEVHGPTLAAHGSGIDAILARMAGHGYRPWVLESRGAPVPYQARHRDRYCNVLFLPEAP